VDRPSTTPTTQRRIADRYRLESVLGRGGMGVVWAAHDEVLGRPVAAKEVLPVPGLSTEQLAEMRDRTLREARTAARMSSSAVLMIYNVVEHDGEPWIVMERLAPRTLADVLSSRGRLDPAEVARLGLRLLDALDAAHASGVLHRDVKPSNVMFRDAESIAQPVLTDFGIARFVGDPAATATGTLIGSPAFVAPERARGEQASPASDLWSLGITLWIAAEGVSPFHRDGTLQTLSAVLTADLPPVEHAPALADALTALLSKDPRERVTSAGARRMLERVAADPTPAPVPLPTAPVATPAPEQGAHLEAITVGPPQRRPGRRRWLVGALLAALVVGGVLIAAPWANDGTTVATPGPTTSPSTTVPPTTPSPTTPSPTTPSPTTPSPTTPSPTTPSPTTPSPTTPSPSSTPSATPSVGPASSAPGAISGGGLVRRVDPTGFAVSVPPGWTTRRQGSQVIYEDPASSAYLKVDQSRTPKGDPVTDWQNQERSVSRRLSNYRLIGINPLTLRGWRGADWEFTHGTGTHVLNRNLVTAPDQAYALYWSAPDRTWARSRALFDQVSASFVPRS